MLKRGMRALMGAVSPIELFASEQSGKLLRGVGEIGADMSALGRGYQGSSRSMLADYFAGHDLGRVARGASSPGYVDAIMKDAAYRSAMQRNQALRVGAVGSAALAYPVSWVAGDGPLTRAGDTGVGVATAAVGAGVLSHFGGVGKAAGWGFLGMSVANMIRGGDQWGPF